MKDTPATLARIDLNELGHAMVLVTYWGRVFSAGTLLELGVAIAKGKKILVVREEDSALVSDFYRGIVDLGLIQEIVWTTSESVAEAVLLFLAELKAST